MDRSDQAPLILTLMLAAADQARFDRLRAAHFPAGRNHIAAHVTMFHHLPGDERETVLAELSLCRQAPFDVAVTGLRSLGRGVAFTLASAELVALHRSLARQWHGVLTAQDRQGYRPHVTIQNKVEPAAARALLEALSAEFVPFTVRAEGLALWHYRGGPWEAAAEVPFRS